VSMVVSLFLEHLIICFIRLLNVSGVFLVDFDHVSESKYFVLLWSVLVFWTFGVLLFNSVPCCV